MAEVRSQGPVREGRSRNRGAILGGAKGSTLETCTLGALIDALCGLILSQLR